MYMTREQAYVKVQNVNYPASYYYQADTRLALLRALEIAGKNVAEYLDGHTFSGVRVPSEGHQARAPDLGTDLNFGDDLYIASGYFGLEHRNLNQLPDLL
jgi:hypothetical protein